MQEGPERVTRTPHLQLTEKTITYPVTGATERQIAESLKHGGILFDNGEHFRGAHVWDLSWNYTYNRDSYGCRLVTTNVYVASAIALPRWTAPPRVEPGLTEKWRRYEAALRAHELGHRERAVEHAKKLRDVLRKLRRRDCDTLKAAVDEAGHAHIREIGRIQDEYDRATTHGRTEGAWWPPPAH